MRELKLTSAFTTSVKSSEREVTGIFSVFGNVDLGGDRVLPGSMQESFKADRPVFLWMHAADQPPVAVITGLKELSRSELPSEVLRLAPEATGGGQVTRRYLTTPRGEELFTALKAGAPLQMSFAYDPVGIQYSTEGGVSVRNLSKLKVLDICDVTYGMNPATIAQKAGYLYRGGTKLTGGKSWAAYLVDARRGIEDMQLDQAGRTLRDLEEAARARGWRH